MKNDLTHLLFILDRSGSMASIARDAIQGFNSFLAQHLEEPGDARLTLVLFDDQFEVPCDGIPLPEATPLDHRTFVPRGSTALLDAIARAIDDLGLKLAATPDDQRPGAVIVAILTDGYENASRHHTWHDVQQRIRHQSDTYQWRFLFLGANQDAIATAARVGIDAHDSATFAADGPGTAASMDAFARKSKSIRKSASYQPMDEQELADLQAPMENILREEDQKKREK